MNETSPEFTLPTLIITSQSNKIALSCWVCHRDEQTIVETINPGIILNDFNSENIFVNFTFKGNAYKYLMRSAVACSEEYVGEISKIQREKLCKLAGEDGSYYEDFQLIPTSLGPSYWETPIIKSLGFDVESTMEFRLIDRVDNEDLGGEELFYLTFDHHIYLCIICNSLIGPNKIEFNLMDEMKRLNPNKHEVNLFHDDFEKIVSAQTRQIREYLMKL